MTRRVRSRSCLGPRRRRRCRRRCRRAGRLVVRPSGVLPPCMSSSSMLWASSRSSSGSASGLSSEGWRSSGSWSSPMPSVGPSVFSGSESRHGHGVYPPRSPGLNPAGAESGSDERQPPLAAGQLLVAAAHGRRQPLGRVGPLAAASAWSSGTPRVDRSRIVSATIADGVALLLDEVAVHGGAVARYDHRGGGGQARARCRGSAATPWARSRRRTTGERTPRRGRRPAARRRPAPAPRGRPPVWPRPGCTSSTSRSPRSRATAEEKVVSAARLGADHVGAHRVVGVVG